ncbi:MAG: DUF4396 domain-containing protein [Legionellales bacterium]|jgi:hypothetical protein
MLEGIIDLWFVFVILSFVFTIFDIRNTPVSWVQKLGWILVVLYTGPFGLFFYLLTCRSPGQNWHALYTQATWKQVINSEVHCAAGDATGVILAAIILSYTALPMNIEVMFEYTLGFISGWIIFQAGMMRSMYKSYGESLKKTFFPEAVSMNFMMLGMIPTMIVLMTIIPESRDPANLRFWFIMSMGALIGGIIAYPINYWLVKNKLKHGCMTLPVKMNMDKHTQHQTMQLSFTNQVVIIALTFILLLTGIFVTYFLLPMEGMQGM